MAGISNTFQPSVNRTELDYTVEDGSIPKTVDNLLPIV